MIGRVFDNRYEVVKRLGSGGMADVYLANDRVLGREVALKVLAPHFAGDEEFVERFRREAAAAASLNHPNIVQIYDRGEAEGTYYIAMEYLEGRSLKEIILKYAPLDPDLVVSVSRQIVEALRYVHRRDIIHRDIKPQNIIVDSEGRVKVTDFGIARAGNVSSLTETGTSVGTAHYLSPEQAQGLPVEAASDLYSLGVVMYEMVTGRLPFNGDNAVGIAMQHVHDTPVTPRSVAPDTPANLEAVILRALGKSPMERYLTAQSMLDDLWRVQEGKPVEPPAGFVEESTRVLGTAELATGGGGQGTERHGQAGEAAEEPPEVEPLPEEYFGRVSSGRRWWPWAAVGVLLIALALTAVGITTWGKTGELGVVPNVIGLSLEEAEARIKDAGFKLRNEGPQASATVAEGLIAGQKPEEGSNMGKGGTVSVWISSGSGPVTVPNVVGKDRFEAIAQLEALGLDVLLQEEPTDETDKVNYVQSQEPVSGTIVDAGATVTIWVAVPNNMAVVPNLIGMSQAAAESALAGVGLVASVEEVDSTEPGGTVVSQEPGAGAQLQAGTAVIIRVSNAPPANMVTVPPVGGLGYTVQEATNILTQHHLNVSIEYYPTSDYQPGIVIQQSPVAGAVVEAGTYVTLTVAEAPPTTTTSTTTTTTLPPTTTTTSPPPPTTTTTATS